MIEAAGRRGARWRIPPRWAYAGGAVLAGLAAGAICSTVNPLLGLLAVAGAGVLAGALALPLGRFWLLAGIISLLPFAVVPVKLGAEVTMLDATLALILGLTALRFLARLQPGVSTPLDLPVLIYVGLCFVAFVFGTAYGVTRQTADYFLKIAAAILLFFALTNGLRTRRMLANFVDALIAGSFGSALLAVVLNRAGQPTAARVLSSLGRLGYPTGASVLRFIAGTDIWRATSTSIDPNIFGGLLMVGLVLLLGRLLAPSPAAADLDPSRPHPGGDGQQATPSAWQRPGWLRWAIGLPALGIMGWALLLSYSRGAWVGLAAGIFFLVALRYRKGLPVALLAVLVAVVTLGHTDFGQHLVTGFLIQDKATEMRIGEYKDALSFISQYPLFGVGFGTTPSGVSITPAADVYVGVSNIYLLMALEIGLVGMAGFAAMLLTLIVSSWRRYVRADAEGRSWIALGAASLFAAAVAGLADHYFFRFPHMVALFWSLIAIVVIAAKQARPAQQPPPAADPARTVPPG